MDGCRMLATVLIPVLVALNPPPVDATGPWPVCGSSGKYTAGSAYQANLQRVIDTLPTNTCTSPAGFATAVIGAGTNQTVYALALCQGDLFPLACFACVDTAIRDGAQFACAFDMDMAMYKDSCHIRFSNHNFLAASTNNSQLHAFFTIAPNLSSSAAGRFNSIVTQLLNTTADHAVAVSKRTKTWFATGEMEVDPDYSGGQFANNIYSTAQCTPDLTPVQCRSCLAAAIVEMPQLVYPRNSPGAIVVGERCGLRFDTFSIFNGDAMVQLHVGGPEGYSSSCALDPTMGFPSPGGPAQGYGYWMQPAAGGHSGLLFPGYWMATQ